MPNRSSSPSQVAVRGYTLLITNVTKVAGIAIAINEAMIRSEIRSGALAIAALMMLGAQVTENVILKAIDRFFGRG